MQKQYLRSGSDEVGLHGVVNWRSFSNIAHHIVGGGIDSRLCQRNRGCESADEWHPHHTVPSIPQLRVNAVDSASSSVSC